MKQNIFRKTTNSSRDLVVDNLTVNGTSTIPGFVDLNSAQTLTNKTISFQNNSMPFVASVNTAQTFSNKTISGSGMGNVISNIGNTALLAGIDAAKISSGVVSNTEFDYLNNVTSNIQTQLDNKVTSDTAQTITGNKLFNNYCNVDIASGVFGLRNNNDSFFLHNISYDGTRNFNIKMTTTDEGSGLSGLEIGYHNSNIRTFPFNQKFAFLSDNGTNTTRINVDTINFLTKGSSSSFDLNNVNNVNVGTGTKIGSIRQDAAQGNTTYITYLPTGANVELKNLEGVTSNIQTQIAGLVDLTSTQNIDGLKTFRSAVNNANSLQLTNTIANNCTLQFENQFSANKVLIRKSNDDLSFIISNVERAKISGDNLNLTNGGEYQVNGTAIRSTSETLTNKTISFASNTLTNVVSTNTTQSITANKTFSPTTLIIDGQVVPKNNITTGAPTVNSDDSAGYSRGSLWYRSINKSFYRCIDATTGAAVWQNLNRRNYPTGYVSTTSASYVPVMYIYTDGGYYNNMYIYTYGDGDHRVQVYNLSGATQIAETGILSSGNQQTSLSLGGPTAFADNTILRVDIKSETGGQSSGAFTVAFD